MKFKNAKVGDQVWSVTAGWGEVVKIHVRGKTDFQDDYPLVMKFKNGVKDSYTLDGKLLEEDIYPNLYWNEFPLPETDPEPQRLPDLNVDDKVYVKDYVYSKWVPRHFKEFDIEEDIWTFANGKTSFTTDDKTCWNFWKTADGKHTNCPEE